jgi:hypothetical protein
MMAFTTQERQCEVWDFIFHSEDYVQTRETFISVYSSLRLIPVIAEGVFKACPFLPHRPHLRASGLTTGEVSL